MLESNNDWFNRRSAALNLRNKMGDCLAEELLRPDKPETFRPDQYKFHMNNMNWVIDHLRKNFPEFDALFPDAEETPSRANVRALRGDEI